MAEGLRAFLMLQLITCKINPANKKSVDVAIFFQQVDTAN